MPEFVLTRFADQMDHYFEAAYAYPDPIRDIARQLRAWEAPAGFPGASAAFDLAQHAPDTAILRDSAFLIAKMVHVLEGERIINEESLNEVFQANWNRQCVFSAVKQYGHSVDPAALAAINGFINHWPHGISQEQAEDLALIYGMFGITNVPNAVAALMAGADQAAALPMSEMDTRPLNR